VIVEDAKTILDLNDDNPDLGGKSLDSRLAFTAPADGEYRIKLAATFDPPLIGLSAEYPFTVHRALLRYFTVVK
jgi:hypothetical protein